MIINIITSLIILFSADLFANKKISDPITPQVNTERLKIGPIYTQPELFEDSIYFVSSTGSLYKSSFNLGEIEKVFDLKQNSVSGLVIDNSFAYFGDGLHASKASNFYAFDLKTKKIKFQKKVTGHLEKKPVIYKDFILVSSGDGGLYCFNKITGDLKWEFNSVNKTDFHIDSTPIITDQTGVAASIYKNKFIFSFNLDTGKIVWKTKLNKNPKSDLLIYKDLIISIASDGDLMNPERLIPSDLVLLNLKRGEINSQHSLRGSTYFPQKIYGDYLFIGLSSGDFISYDFQKKIIKSLHQTPEPILSTPYIKLDQICFATTMGREYCSDKSFKKFVEIKLFESIIGVSHKIKDLVYLPTRNGYIIR